MYKKKFLNLFTFYISFLWFTSFSKSILPVHFFEQGLSFSDIILGTLLLFLSQAILLLTWTRQSSKLSWRLSLISFFVYILLIITIRNNFQFYLASIISGLYFFFFYILYNIAHFEHTPKTHTGLSSALMFGVAPTVSIAAPLLAGYLAQVNIAILWVFSTIFFLLSFFFVRFQEDFKIAYKVRTALNEIKATRLLLFLEGVWEAMIFGVIPVYTLGFIKVPLQYGAFVSYLSLIGVLANLLVGRFTDKLRRRVIFLYPLTLSIAIITFLFPIAKSNLGLWILMTGVIQFLLPLFWNVSTAMVIDAHPNLRSAIPGRELVLAFGRVIGLGITFLCFSIDESSQFIFFILGSVLLIYPLCLFWKDKIKKNYKFL